MFLDLSTCLCTYAYIYIYTYICIYMYICAPARLANVRYMNTLNTYSLRDGSICTRNDLCYPSEGVYVRNQGRGGAWQILEKY